MFNRAKGFFGKLGRRQSLNQKGIALPLVLCVLAVGGLTIAASLNYSTTVLKAHSTIKHNVDGIYAADAGVEHAIWSVMHGIPPLTQLPEQINHLSVNMSTVCTGNFTLYLGDLVGFSSKPGVLSVTSNLTQNGTDRYRYDIIIVREDIPGPETIHLQEVGVRLPPGFSYNDTASRSDGRSLGSGNPIMSQDEAGAWMLQWQWGSSIRPKLENDDGDNIFILSFYITGPDEPEGEYAWTVADATGYGLYGELTGGRYVITANAVRPSDNRTISRIIAELIKQGEGTSYITSWNIAN
ncbi:MAG: hypothetical protein Q7R50_03940 [Dehalococcoidales bacterium]|nr:hypothetical protein [Dehalococcoidales bacterium]